MVEGHPIDRGFLRPETQPDVGDEANAKGAETLADFFRTQVEASG